MEAAISWATANSVLGLALFSAIRKINPWLRLVTNTSFKISQKTQRDLAWRPVANGGA